MRILMISDVYFPRINGVSTSIQTFKEELENLGHHVVLIAPDYPQASSSNEADPSIYRIRSRQVIFDPEDRMMRVKDILALTEYLRTEQFDLVHVHTPFVAHYAGRKLARALSLPLILTYHTLFEEYFYHYIPFLPRALLKSVARYFSRAQCNDATAIIAPSTIIVDLLKNYGVNQPIEILPTGICCERFQHGDGRRFRKRFNIDVGRKVLLNVSRVAFEKNIGLLLEMVNKVRQEIPEVCLVIFCRPSPDFLPSPMASLITGITPQQASESGLTEAEFIARILAEFSQPGTCVAGYNSIRFDDEVTRQLLYRNFYDPYEREWKNGNSRWDIIDMVRLCAATRPLGIEWPKRVDSSISFRLEELTAANGIEHSQAHDALSDVYATIDMAKLIREHQPKLYDYAYKLRNKRQVQAAIDMSTRKPVLHISGMYPAHQGCMALVMPLCPHPTNNNGIVVYDLRHDPDTWMDLSADEIRTRLYTPNAELREGQERIPLKTIHTNKCPIVAAASVLTESAERRAEIDMDECRANWDKLANNGELIAKLGDVFSREPQFAETDPDYMIYSGGFFSDADRSLMQTVRATPAVDLGRLDLPFRDSRLQEMLFRYRARNYPETLNNEEAARWQEFRLGRLQDAEALKLYDTELDEARERADSAQQEILDKVEDYVTAILKPD